MSSDSPPLTGALSIAASVSTTASGRDSSAAGASSVSGCAKLWSTFNNSGSAGSGFCPERTASNISLTASNAFKITSIKSDVTFLCPLRRISKTFSASWQQSTKGFNCKKPAPPFTVWKPRKIAFNKS